MKAWTLMVIQDMYMMQLILGLKYDMNELNAAYALAQLERKDSFIERRREIAKIYDEKLKGCPHISTPIKKRDHYIQPIYHKNRQKQGLFARE